MTFHKCILFASNSVRVHDDIRHSMLESKLEILMKLLFNTIIYQTIVLILNNELSNFFNEMENHFYLEA